MEVAWVPDEPVLPPAVAAGVVLAGAVDGAMVSVGDVGVEVTGELLEVVGGLLDVVEERCLIASCRRMRARRRRARRRRVARSRAAARSRAFAVETSARATQAVFRNPAAGRPPAVGLSRCASADPRTTVLRPVRDGWPPPSMRAIVAMATRHVTTATIAARRGRSGTRAISPRRGAGETEEPHGRRARGRRGRGCVGGAEGVAGSSACRAEGRIAPCTAAAPSPQKSSAPGTVSSRSRARARDPIGTSSSGGPSQSRGRRTTLSTPSPPVPSMVSRSSVFTDLLRLSGREVALPRPPGQVV